MPRRFCLLHWILWLVACEDLLVAKLNAEVLRLAPGVPVVVEASQPLAVQKAAKDLCRDLEWVLKAPSKLLSQVPDGNEPAIVIAQATSAQGLSGPEAHTIVRDGQRVRLVGSDMRGVIYAIYSFSEQFLDIAR